MNCYLPGGKQATGAAVQAATLVIAILPFLCIYPFLQRYFVKGMLIGAIKG